MALLLGVLALAGCSVGPPPGHVSPAEAVYAEVSRRPVLSDTCMARTSIEARIPQGKFPLHAALVFRHPDLLRVESLPLIGPPDFFLLADGSNLKVYFPAQGKYYTGRATARNVSRFLPVNLSPREIVSILMGRAPVGPENAASVKAVVDDGPLYRIDERLAGGMVQSQWFDPVRKTLVRAEVRSFFGTVRYSVKFQDFVVLDGTALPGRVEVAAGDDGRTGVTIRYVDLQISRDADPTLFVFPDPPGVEAVVLD